MEAKLVGGWMEGWTFEGANNGQNPLWCRQTWGLLICGKGNTP